MNDHYLIDAFNLHYAVNISESGVFQEESLGHLIRDIEKYACLTGHKVTFVLDGTRYEGQFPSSKSMKICCSGAGETADGFLERFMAKIQTSKRMEYVLVSGDRQLRDMAMGFGVRTRNPEDLWSEICAVNQENRKSETNKTHAKFNAPFEKL